MPQHADREDKLHIETIDFKKELQQDKAKGITVEMLRQDIERRKRRLLGLPVDDDDKTENKKSDSGES